MGFSHGDSVLQDNPVTLGLHLNLITALREGGKAEVTNPTRLGQNLLTYKGS